MQVWNGSFMASSPVDIRYCLFDWISVDFFCHSCLEPVCFVRKYFPSFSNMKDILKIKSI